jgi:hypothetical protein
MWWAAATAVMGGTTGGMAMALRLAGESPLPKTAGSPHTLARPTIVSEMAVTSGKILSTERRDSNRLPSSVTVVDRRVGVDLRRHQVLTTEKKSQICKKKISLFCSQVSKNVSSRSYQFASVFFCVFFYIIMKHQHSSTLCSFVCTLAVAQNHHKLSRLFSVEIKTFQKINFRRKFRRFRYKKTAPLYVSFFGGVQYFFLSCTSLFFFISFSLVVTMLLVVVLSPSPPTSTRKKNMHQSFFEW